jgi:hypothetical protein
MYHIVRSEQVPLHLVQRFACQDGQRKHSGETIWLHSIVSHFVCLSRFVSRMLQVSPRNSGVTNIFISIWSVWFKNLPIQQMWSRTVKMIIIMFSVYKNINNFATSSPSEPKVFGICRGVSVCRRNKIKIRWNCACLESYILVAWQPLLGDEHSFMNVWK